MAAIGGRKLLIKKGGTVIAGVTQKSLTINHGTIDITTDDDNGYKKYLADAADHSLELSISGVAVAEVLRKIGLLSGVTNTYLTDITVVWPDGDTLACDFILSSYEESGQSGDKVTFSCKLSSSGSWTFTDV